jgi:hypothetical protein
MISVEYGVSRIGTTYASLQRKPVGAKDLPVDNPAKVALATHGSDWDAFEPNGSDHALGEALLHLELSASTCGQSRRGRRERTQSLCSLAFPLIDRFELTGVARTNGPLGLSSELIHTVADPEMRAGSAGGPGHQSVAGRPRLRQPCSDRQRPGARVGSPRTTQEPSRPPRRWRRVAPRHLGDSAGWPGGSA